MKIKNVRKLYQKTIDIKPKNASSYNDKKMLLDMLRKQPLSRFMENRD